MHEIPPMERVVASALAEDLGVDEAVFLSGAVTEGLLERDVTSASVIGEDEQFSGAIASRGPGVVCGLAVAAEVFERLSRAAGLFDPVEFFPVVAEGSRVTAGTVVAEVDGNARAVLAGERSALNLLMVLSGIATETARWVEAAGTVAVCDTRKTLPGLRALSKYAVRVGGGTNHRFGLHDMALIKDNHLARAGSVAAAVGRARLRHPDTLVEVEADEVDQARQAVAAGADYVLLDNMDDPTLADAVRICREEAAHLGRTVVLEVSGDVTFERLRVLRDVGVDRVSSSKLSLAAPLDFGLDER